jgi:hypothetical protein
MQIENVLSKHQLVPLVFGQDAVAASQTDVQLYAQEVHGAAALAVTGYTMPFAGQIVAISYDLSAAATAGTLTIGPTIGGVEVADPTLSITTGTTGSDTCNRNKATFAKNAIIGAEITSSAGWDGTASDLLVVVWVILTLTGI